MRTTWAYLRIIDNECPFYLLSDFRQLDRIYNNEHYTLLQEGRRAKMMSEAEANHIAESIRSAALREIRVATVEQNPSTKRFQVRCLYYGPTFKYGQQLYLHGMPLRIKKSYDWTKLYSLLKRR
jgi:hypothetical protein